MQVTMPDGRTFMMVTRRRGPETRKKFAQMIAMYPPPRYKDWPDWFNRQHPTEDVEHEIVELKQLTNGTQQEQETTD